VYEDKLRIAAEVDAAGNVVTRYVYALRPNVPEYMVRAGVSYRLVTDHLGSVRLVVNASTGVVMQRIDYDEWGRVSSDSNPGFQPFGYAGGLYDADTGLVRFGARDYDAGVGRWTAKDPIRFEGGMPTCTAMWVAIRLAKPTRTVSSVSQECSAAWRSRSEARSS
jgi:RHS repeat-associated protein